ncbi:MAG: hypothetical protein DHS20C02_08250 [Micavibrio sp.]|nr:MAG: hypothetical protein DHS20C02_08250 [Micavibrio sp.]
MNKNILIVLGGAVAVALVVAMLVQVTLGGQKDQPTQMEEKLEVLVATKDLSIGSELKAGDLRWQSWPKGSVFSGAVIRKDGKKAEEALEGRLRRDITEGEPVLRSALLSESKGNFVAASLDPGMRAVALKVSAESMVGGFIGPGDRVDIILTYKEKIKTDDEDPRAQDIINKNLSKLATETILQNVTVLAIDQMATRPDDDKIKVGKTVSVAVDIYGAEKLALAREMGELTLSLRGIGDDAIVADKWPTLTDARLTTIYDEVHEEYKNFKKDSGLNTNIVRIYSGGQVQAVPAR